MPITTFNPSDLSAITLSGANLVATATAQGGVRSVDSVATGKYYFEITVNTITSGNTGPGIANASAVLSTFAPNANFACIAYRSGAVWVNGPTGRGIGAYSSGAIIGIAVDLNTYQIWFRQSPAGLWFNAGGVDPATGTAGLTIASIASSSIPIFGVFGSGVSGEKATANFGGSAFSGAVPSGYTAGFTGIAAGQAALAMVLA